MSTPSVVRTYPPGFLKEYQGDRLLATSIAFIIVDVLFVTLRIYSRRLAGTTRSWDDYLIPPALVFNIGVCIVGICKNSSCASMDLHSHCLGAVGTYSGYHEAAIPPERLTGAIMGILKTTFAVEFLYLPAILCAKLSIAFLYLRIFTGKTTRTITYVVMSVLVANYVAFLVTEIPQCSPIAYAWDKSIKGGHCFNQPLYYTMINVPNIATDAVMLVLPMPTVWRLHMPTIRKFGLTLIFVAGCM